MADTAFQTMFRKEFIAGFEKSAKCKNSNADGVFRRHRVDSSTVLMYYMIKALIL